MLERYADVSSFRDFADAHSKDPDPFSRLPP